MMPGIKKEEVFLDWKSLLWLCLPAILLGLFLRVWLTAQMPYSFIQPDSMDLLATPDHLFKNGVWYIAPKKTFLTPLLYTLTFFLPFPALSTIAIGQHALGLLLILMVGLISRLWFRQWLFLTPITTLLTALNPTLLWYEHTLMAESHYVFCVVLTALTGTWFARKKTSSSFLTFVFSLFLTAGSRPEGKLFFAFGLLLTLVISFPVWRKIAWQMSLILLVALGTSRFTKSSQAGLLLYTSVITLTPNSLQSAPGFEPYILPTRDRLRVEWKIRYYDMAKVRKEITRAIETYLSTQGINPSSKTVNRLCLRLAIETCLKNPFQLPGIALTKFRQTLLKLSSGSFDEEWLVRRQIKTVTSDLNVMTRYSQKLTHQNLKTLEDYKKFIHTHYQISSNDFFLKQQNRWNQLTNFGVRTTFDFSRKAWVPPFYLIALLGLLLSPWLKRHLLPYHLTWIAMMLGLWFVIFLTANTKERFRFVFEPFWILYLAALGDFIVNSLQVWLKAQKSRISPSSEEKPKNDKLETSALSIPS